MILQALCEYYDRKEHVLPPFGFEEKSIPFTIVIDRSGKFVQLEANTEESLEGKLVVKTYRVPKASGRSGAKSYETAYCLWDHYGYVLAQPKLAKPDSEPSQKEIDTGLKQHDSFKSVIEKLKNEVDDKGVQAAWLFLTSFNEVEAVKQHELWNDCLKVKGCNLTFRLAGEPHLVCQSTSVIEWVKKQPLPDNDFKKGFCLVTGKTTNIARLHDQVAGVNQKPAPLAAINDSAYNSIGKEKGFNFPVGTEAVFKYVTALNHLLQKNSHNKFRILETSYIYWSEKGGQLEAALPSIFNDNTDNPDAGVKAVKALFSSIYNGAYTAKDGNDRFFLLGLAPNSARIMVRFWQVGTVAQFSENLAKWFSDLALDGKQDDGYPTVKQLLRATALQYKDDNVAPNLPASLVRSILLGTALPATLLQAVLRRIKAEQGNLTYNRACLIKAYLNRAQHHKEITMALNHEEHRVGYCLGRLFACLEKLQQDAQPGIKATIRDRYYSSASCSPNSVFGTLMRLSNHHLNKIEKVSWKVVNEKRIQEVMGLISGFPAHLNLENQGLFAIGYYHQKQEFFKKTEKQGEKQ